MTTTQARPIRTVYATIKSKADEPDGRVKAELLIDAFKSKFPTYVRIPKEGADLLTVGHGYTIMLQQDRLKDGKTGQYPTDYWYSWAGLAEPGMEDQGVRPTDGLAASAVQEPQTNHRDATGVSIERQTGPYASAQNDL